MKIPKVVVHWNMFATKRNFLFLTLIAFTCCIAHAQNLNITLCPLFKDDLVKSMICVSNANGQSLFEYILTENDLYNGSEFSITVPDPQLYCFTIINEYQIDTINQGHPFHLIKTYYNVGGNLNIIKFDHPKIPEFYPEKPALISLHNTPVIEHWSHATDATISSFKQTKTDVWAQSNFRPGEDLFLIMKVVNDSRYRYIYIPADEIPPFDKNMRPSDAIQLDWKFLRTDLNQLSIDLPFDSEFRGSISAVNSKTGNKCMFFAKRHLDNEINYPENYEIYNPPAPQLIAANKKLEVFIPAQALLDFYANLTWFDKQNHTKYEYRIRHGYELKFPHFDENFFLPEYFKNDTLGIHTKMNSFPGYFRIFFEKKVMDAHPQKGEKLHQRIRSLWIVIGKNKGEIDFILPMISESNKTQFEGFGNWHYDRFENVKFLEKDPNIDWINFFNDYNVLLVSYRDPLK